MPPRISLPDSTYTSEETPLIATADAIKTPAVDLRAETYGTIENENTWGKKQEKNKPVQIFTKRIIALIFALGIFTYHSMTYDHLLPIFLEDDRGDPVSSISTLTQSLTGFNPLYSPGGLGMSVQKVGGMPIHFPHI